MERIVVNAEVLNGKPVIKGTRLSVSFMSGLLGQGAPFEEIIEEYKGIEKEDILACMEYAAKMMDNQFVGPLPQSA